VFGTGQCLSGFSVGLLGEAADGVCHTLFLAFAGRSASAWSCMGRHTGEIRQRRDTAASRPGDVVGLRQRGDGVLELAPGVLWAVDGAAVAEGTLLFMGLGRIRLLEDLGRNGRGVAGASGRAGSPGSGGRFRGPMDRG
jgi:hypothetical protein